jgi:hypothetical protein
MWSKEIHDGWRLFNLPLVDQIMIRICPKSTKYLLCYPPMSTMGWFISTQAVEPFFATEQKIETSDWGCKGQRGWRRGQRRSVEVTKVSRGGEGSCQHIYLCFLASRVTIFWTYWSWLLRHLRHLWRPCYLCHLRWVGEGQWRWRRSAEVAKVVGGGEGCWRWQRSAKVAKVVGGGEGCWRWQRSTVICWWIYHMVVIQQLACTIHQLYLFQNSLNLQIV